MYDDDEGTPTGAETLHTFRIRYTDETDPGFGVDTWRTRAYDEEHAEERFFDAPDGDGWRILSIERLD